MDPFNNPNNPNVPNNPNNPNNPTQPNVFSVPGYYSMIEPNQFSQYSSNAFAASQHSPNQFSRNQALQQLMMRGAFNLQPNPMQPVQPQSEPDQDVKVVPETQPQKEKGKRRKGNNQTGDVFWKAVLAKFLGLMDQGPYRDIDSVSSKWQKMNGFVNKFCEEYNKIYSSGRRSDMSDEDVFKKALEKYKENNGNTSFAHVRAWEVL
ncbi:sporozoite surface protein 2-like [Helianthus annuus]|uniref:sporozoite surface protein 2-like n=1 Tax=Helianthus annuus TaxID=4232 RepID=UPI000B8FB5C2|nr:sporozoite surface protein 2-like [Helianthus annuus]